MHVGSEAIGQRPDPWQSDRPPRGEEIGEGPIAGLIRPRPEQVGNSDVNESSPFRDIDDAFDAGYRRDELPRDKGGDPASHERPRRDSPLYPRHAATQQQQGPADEEGVRDIGTPRQPADAQFERQYGNVGRNAGKRQAESQEVGATIPSPQNRE